MKTVYVRDANRNPWACIVVDEFGYGYFIGHPRYQFNKKVAREIAEGRLNRIRKGRLQPMSREEMMSRVPKTYHAAFNQVLDRITLIPQTEVTEYAPTMLPVESSAAPEVKKGWLSFLGW